VHKYKCEVVWVAGKSVRVDSLKPGDIITYDYAYTNWVFLGITLPPGRDLRRVASPKEAKKAWVEYLTKLYARRYPRIKIRASWADISKKVEDAYFELGVDIGRPTIVGRNLRTGRVEPVAFLHAGKWSAGGRGRISSVSIKLVK
jgi:hypothetical protein